MLLLNSNKAKIIAMILFISLGLFLTTIFAQEKDEVKSKLDNLKGKIEKLTVKVDGKDVVFEGKDAENLFKKLKEKSHSGVMYISGDDDEMMAQGKGNVMMFKSKGGKDFNLKLDSEKKKVKVEIEDGKKKVSVTSTKDGKEETKVYEGEEAEKFLIDEKENTRVRIITEGDDDMPGDRMMYFNRKLRGNDCDCSCCGSGKHRGMMMRMPFGGKNMKHMIIKEFNDDDEKSEKAEKKVEKKIEKK